jgi:hypothetical protein
MRLAGAAREAGGLEDAPNRRPPDAVPHVLQHPLNPRIASRLVLFRHPDHQATDLTDDLTPVDRGAAIRPFPRNELPVPPQQRIRSGDRGDVV